MIIGSGFLSNIQDVKTLKALFEFSYKNKIITEEKNNLNFLTPHASRIGNLLLGNTTNFDCQPLSQSIKKILMLFFLLVLKLLQTLISKIYLKFILVIMVMKVL